MAYLQVLMQTPFVTGFRLFQELVRHSSHAAHIYYSVDRPRAELTRQDRITTFQIE